MKEEYNVSAGDDKELGVLPVTKNNWRYIFFLLGGIASVALILIILFAERPKRFEPMKKRIQPAVRSIYTVIVSPLDSASAHYAVQSMQKELGNADSSNTNMTIAGTAIFKPFQSLAEFSRILDSALKVARPIGIKDQALLMTQINGVLMKDTLPAAIHLYGTLNAQDCNSVAERLNAAAGNAVHRNAVFGPLEIVSHLRPRDAAVTQQFLGFFRQRGIKVREEE